MSNMKRELEKRQARVDAAKEYVDLRKKMANDKKNIISTIKTIDLSGFTNLGKKKVNLEAKGGLQEATARLKAQGLKKGGSPKKKKKFPDLSGDGKVTMKDILMARGVIKKKKTKKKGKKK